MPFNFRLGKRSQQYNVASKDLFVIPIELLTNECIECTLFSTSTGQECLNNVCQKIGIQQSEYFSLLFRSKKNVDQWVDLSKPLKKQLSKYAAETRLYFRLQYFVPNFHFLSDELSRYHYFCAMKNLVIDGRIACSRDDAILLASFSLQAEFGDYSPERHTVEYLNNFSLFPKSMVTSKIARDVLIECAINAYRNLQGVPPSVAEIYYISEAQRREGYGQEGFPAKDLSIGQDVCLGVCIRGIFVVNTDNNTLELFKWMDIANLMHNKKVFTIEKYSDKYSKSYSTYDSDYANCIWQTCVEQHQYFMKGIQNAANETEQQQQQQTQIILDQSSSTQQQQTSISTSNLLNNNNHSISSIPLIHGADLFHNNNNNNDNSLQKISSTNGNNVPDSTTIATDYNSRIQSVYETIGSSSANAIQDATTMAPPPLTISSTELLDAKQEYSMKNGGTNLTNLLRKRSSTEPVELHHITINCNANNYNLKSGELSTETNNITSGTICNNNSLLHSDIQSNSSSSNIPIYENQSNLNDLTYEQRKKLLPPYRQPPDYETFLKNKYLVNNNLSQSLSSIPSRLASHNNNQNQTTTNPLQMNSASSSSSLIHPNNLIHNVNHHYNNNNIHDMMISTSAMSVPQLFQQQYQQQQKQFAGNVYRNYTDLSQLNAENNIRSLAPIATATHSAVNHRCSLPPTADSLVDNYHTLGLNQLNYQHQQLQKSGMFTSSSPDLNSLNMVYKRNIQNIKSNGIAKINEVPSSNGINLRNQMKNYFTSVPDLSFKNQNSNPMNCDLGIEKKFKSKSFFSFGGKNFKFFWQHNKTGSEPNLFNNFSYSPNCYNLKRSKFSTERLDNFPPMRNASSNYIGDTISARPSMSYTISQKIDELPETNVEQSQTNNTMNTNKNETNNDNDQPTNMAVSPNIIQSDQQPANRQQPSQVIYINLNPNESKVKTETTVINQENPPPAPSITKACSRIIVFDKSFDDQDFTKEFELLPRMNPTAKFTTASLPENVLRNRFRDILPYEENRVKLATSKDNKHGYINASHVVMSMGFMKQHYIAAQGPLPNTTIEFWQMVFEQHINLIVMVTNFTEAGSQKCYTYLPLSDEPDKNTLRFGDYEIICNYTSATLTYISSYLTLSYHGQRRSITHLRYTDWNDHSIPGDLQNFLTFLSEMDTIYRQNNSGSGLKTKKHHHHRSSSKIHQQQQQPLLPPILVHCSAGAGRSGVVILCDALLKCLDHNFEPIDIPKALIQLRFQRMISVQHCEQFRFVCQVLSQYLSNSRLI